MSQAVHPSPLCPPIAEPGVYLSSCEWDQQPRPQEVWQRGLPSTGLPAQLPESTQEGKRTGTDRKRAV